jgi:hypothetical protein
VALKALAGVLLCATVVLVFYSAKTSPLRINVTTVDAFSGHVHLMPCVKNASNPVRLDRDGRGVTSACPSDGNVEMILNTEGQKIHLLPAQIQVERAGTGDPVGIEADVEHNR